MQIYFFTMKNIYLFIVSLFFFYTGCDTQQTKYPFSVETVLAKAGNNRKELEKALDYFYKQGDSIKIKAIEFLVAHMDIHYSETYYWKTREGKRVDFSEFDYANLETAVKAIDSMRKKYGSLDFQDTIIYDVNSLTGKYLINNVNHAVDTWRLSEYKDIPFNDFCEYILPYRVTVEPVTEWRKEYCKRYHWLTDSLQNKPLENVLDYAAIDYKDWFTFTYGSETRNEPLSRLSAQQLLFRKKGACEDIAALETFIFRSQGIPAAYISVPLWETSAGAHFSNTVFDTKMKPVKLDVTTHAVVDHPLDREPSKVIRYTYSSQPGTLASKEKEECIPTGFLQKTNYIDVTHEYWETSDVTIPLFNDTTHIIYACMFSMGRWNAEWWGERMENSVTFHNMPRGVVILPMIYKEHQLIPIGYPIVNGYNHQLYLVPDLLHTMTVEIEEQDRYLRFRPDKKYELFYWDNAWISLGTQVATMDADCLQFNQVPQNVLMLLVPEYSERKERPFIIMPDGTRYWW